MTQIIEKLGENPEIQLVSGADDFCRTCPNRVGELGCQSDEKVLGYDAAVLNLCGLKTGEKLLWQEFSQRVHEEILNRNLREEVCGGCQWTGLCSTSVGH